MILRGLSFRICGFEIEGEEDEMEDCMWKIFHTDERGAFACCLGAVILGLASG